MWSDEPVRDEHTGLFVPEASCQVLDGSQARKFVRSRSLEYKDDAGDWVRDGTADLGRITRQQIFVRRAVTKAASRGPTNLGPLNQPVPDRKSAVYGKSVSVRADLGGRAIIKTTTHPPPHPPP